MLEESKSWETAAGDWVWFIGTVHMDTHMDTHLHIHMLRWTEHKVLELLTKAYVLYRHIDVDTIPVYTYICIQMQYNIQIYEYKSIHKHFPSDTFTPCCTFAN